MGALCGGAEPDALESLGQFGLKIGLGFQIADDILDVSASSTQLGKTAGKDQKAGKLTYPALIGLERAQVRAQELTDEALGLLRPLGNEAEPLRQLALALLERNR